MNTFDTIVIGGGIAGLLTALRLARGGHAVALIEADRLGSGATCANHGMLHSGALYVRQHGHVVRHCQQAHAAFSALFADAELSAGEAIYIVPTHESSGFLSGLDEHRIAHRETSVEEVPELRRSVADNHTLVAIAERVFSSRRIVDLLTAQCLAGGVTLVTGNTVHTIAVAFGKVNGIVLGAAEHLRSNQVVIAAGIGTAQLLTELGSRQVPLLKSRLDMMIHFPSARITRGLIFAALDHPVVMPTAHGGALASFFGGVQPQIVGRRAFPVDLAKAKLLLHETSQAFAPGTVESEGAVVYVAGKTDYVGSVHTEKGIVNPGYHVIDHEPVDNLHGLYTVITGKMTLGFHASKAVADAILGTDLPLVIHPAAAPATPAGLLALDPWIPAGQM